VRQLSLCGDHVAARQCSSQDALGADTTITTAGVRGRESSQHRLSTFTTGTMNTPLPVYVRVMASFSPRGVTLMNIQLRPPWGFLG
jgi:hypothetical protein